MRPRFIRIVKKEDGATAIEFALVAPILFLLIIGILEFGLILHISAVIENAINEGARFSITGSSYEALNPDSLDRATFIDEMIYTRLGPWLYEQGNVEIASKTYSTINLVNLGDIDPENPDNPPHSYGGGNELVMYVVTYHWKILTPIMSQFMGDDDGQYEIRATVISKNENYCDDAFGLSCNN